MKDKPKGPAREMGARRGRVLEASSPRRGLTRARVEVGEERVLALAYPLFSGEIREGDEVLLNTTALDLGLGTGGVHFVMANLSQPGEARLGEAGHVMKLRYTPLQFKSLSLEEAHGARLEEGGDLGGMPVMVLELHSMVLPAALAFKRAHPGARLAYLMTDGGSLPLAFSDQVEFLRQEGFIDAAITAGQAFGGDLEAVNVYTALQGARHVLGADACIAAMGPGVLGTGTAFGFSGIEQGENINRVNVLGGAAVTCLRLSFAEKRERHRGVSHHSLTSLGRAALTPASVALPRELKGEERGLALAQLEAAGLPGIHTLCWHETAGILEELAGLGRKVNTMGRGLGEDPFFFAAAAAAGREGARCLEKSEQEAESLWS